MQKFLLGLTLVAAGLAGATTSVSAATVYASTIEDVFVGDRPTTPRNVDYVGPNRYTQTNILGAPNGAPDAELDDPFYSLGVGGYIVLGFGGPVRTPGTAIEVTFNRFTSGDNGPETFEIYVSNTTDFLVSTFLGGFSNQFGESDGRNLSFALSADVGDFRYVKIVDTTGANGIDGVDIGSIGFSPVPVPAAGLLLGGALMGLGALRRRARKAA